MDSSIYSLYWFFIYFPFKTLGCISLLSGYYLCHLDLHRDKKCSLLKLLFLQMKMPPPPRYPAVFSFLTGREAAEKAALTTKTLSERQHPNSLSWCWAVWSQTTLPIATLVEGLGWLWDSIPKSFPVRELFWVIVTIGMNFSWGGMLVHQLWCSWHLWLFCLFGLDSCLCLPKSAVVLPKSKPSVEDWHLQVQLFNQVEISFLKVFQADLYKHRKKKKLDFVTDTVKVNIAQ